MHKDGMTFMYTCKKHKKLFLVKDKYENTS